MNKDKMRSLLNLNENFLAKNSREEAARTGLGRLALAMQPELPEGDSVDDPNKNPDIVSEEPVEEDSTDATAQLDQDVAASMYKPGQIIPIGVLPGQFNPSGMGTQDTHNMAHQDDAYGKEGETMGMAIPASRRGSYAPPVGKSAGTAPDGPEKETIPDPEVQKVFRECFDSYAEALDTLIRVGLTITEASLALEEGIELGESLRSIMLQIINEAKKAKKSIAKSASKKRRQFFKEDDEKPKASGQKLPEGIEEGHEFYITEDESIAIFPVEEGWVAYTLNEELEADKFIVACEDLADAIAEVQTIPPGWSNDEPDTSKRRTPEERAENRKRNEKGLKNYEKKQKTAESYSDEAFIWEATRRTRGGADDPKA